MIVKCWNRLEKIHTSVDLGHFLLVYFTWLNVKKKKRKGKEKVLDSVNTVFVQ